MNAKDLGKFVKEKNNEMNKVLDPRVDDFIEQFKAAISEAYDKGKGYMYAGCNRVGIAIKGVDMECLSEIEFDVCTWILAGSEDLEKGYEMLTFWDFINQPYEKWKNIGIAGQVCYEIYDLRYLVTEFEKRGFKCYADGANEKLVVVFEI